MVAWQHSARSSVGCPNMAPNILTQGRVKDIAAQWPQFSRQAEECPGNCGREPQVLMERLTQMEPVIKYPGGKRLLAPLYRAELPKDLSQRNYYEPMCGGAACWGQWHQEFRHTTIGDVSEHLIGFYRVLQDPQQAAAVVAEIEDRIREYNGDLSQQERLFYLWRDVLNGKDTDNASRAVAYWLVNHTAFNGLMRYNRAGVYNVPWGKYKMVRGEPKKLLRWGAALTNTTIVHGTYVDTLTQAPMRAGDVVFLDPPYPGGFTAYSKYKFDDDDQLALAKHATVLQAAGVLCYISLPDLPKVRKMYSAFRPVQYVVGRSISRNGGGRAPVGELLLAPPIELLEAA